MIARGRVHAQAAGRARRALGLRRIALVLGVALAFAGCAPRRLEAPRLDRESVRSRFAASLAKREQAMRSADAELSLWASSRHLGALPGVSARLLLGGPGVFRLRIASPFGTALDAAAHGDSLVAFSPHDRRVLILPSARDSLGIADLGGLGCRMWSAAFRPPAAAWTSAAWSESLLVLRWQDEEDSLALALGSNGLPASLAVARAEGRSITVRYESWMSVDGVWWPAVAACADQDQNFEIRWRVQRVKFASSMDPERLRVALPADWRRVTLADLGRALRRLAPN